MKLISERSKLAAAIAIATCLVGGTAQAQDYGQGQDQATEDQAMEGREMQDRDQLTGENEDALPPDRRNVRAKAATKAGDELRGMEPVVPVGPAVVPVKKVIKQVGPAVVPVAPVEKIEAVETVTLQTDHGPVVVISWPGSVPASDYNIDFSMLDANGDDYVSRAEVNAMQSRSVAVRNLGQAFETADNNADGRLAFTEVLQWVY